MGEQAQVWWSFLCIRRVKLRALASCEADGYHRWVGSSQHVRLQSSCSSHVSMHICPGKQTLKQVWRKTPLKIQIISLNRWLCIYVKVCLCICTAYLYICYCAYYTRMQMVCF